MTDPNPGPLDRLRAANPVPRAVSQPDESTLEEILMTTTETTTEAAPGPDTPGTPPSARSRLPLILGVAAALLLLVGVVGALAGAGDDDVDTDQVAGPAVDGPSTDDITTDPAVDDGSSSPAGPGGDSQVTSCVETYSPDTLVNREYAFDGTVQSVDGSNMTFSVNEWFSAGTETTVTLDHQGYAGMLLDPDTALEPGTRALIAGDGGFVWSCGFTQLWTDAAAAEWRAAFAG